MKKKRKSLIVLSRGLLVVFSLLLGVTSSTHVLAVPPVDGGVSNTVPLPPGGGNSTTDTPPGGGSPTGGTDGSSIDQQFYGGNDILFYNPTCSNVGTSNDASLVEGENKKKAFFYFTGKGLSAAQAAGIVGNLMQESGVNPKSVQKGGPGRGIAQWSKGDRWDGPQKDSFKNWAGSKDMLDLKVQLDFIWYEMNNVSPWKKALKGSTSSAYPSLQDIKGDTKDAAIKAGHSFGYLYERFGVSGSRDKYSGDVWTEFHSQVEANTALGNDPGGDGCQGDAETGMCENAPAGWVQVTNKVVQIACAEWNKKVVEDRGDNCDAAGNIKKYAKEAGFGSCGLAWCGMFVNYVYKTAGFPFPSSAGVASVPSLYSYLGRVGARQSPSSDPKPGSVVTYGTHHTGLVVGVQGKYVTTIEGNTGPDPQDKVNKSGHEGVHMHHRTHPGFGQSAWGDYDVLSKKQAK